MNKKSRTTRDLERLIRNWESYRDMVMAALATDQTSERQEKKFLELKAELAAQLQWLDETLPRSMAYESHQSAEVMADLMRRHVTLRTFDMDQRWDPQDFQNTWHQYFIYLNRLRGAKMNAERDHAEAGPVVGSEKSRGREAIGWVLTIGFAVLVLFVLASAMGLGWGESGPTFNAPASIQEAAGNVGSFFTALWAGPSSLFEPVTAAYGLQWGFGLIGLLVVASGAFFLSRQH
jgi:hypothetical protein